MNKVFVLLFLFKKNYYYYCYYYYYYYNKSVPLFITRANTNNVDRLLFLYSSRRAYFKAHILRGGNKQLALTNTLSMLINVFVRNKVAMS